MSTVQKYLMGGLLVVLFGTLYLGIHPMRKSSHYTNRPIPSFKLPVLGNPSKVLTENDLQNRLTVLHFWSTWCQSCHREHPLWLSLAKSAKPYLVGINFYDDLKDAQHYLQEQGDPFAFHLADDEGQLGIDLGIHGTPETFLIDSKGRITGHHRGPMTLEVWETYFVPTIQAYEEIHHGE